MQTFSHNIQCRSRTLPIATSLGPPPQCCCCQAHLAGVLQTKQILPHEPWIINSCQQLEETSWTTVSTDGTSSPQKQEWVGPRWVVLHATRKHNWSFFQPKISNEAKECRLTKTYGSAKWLNIVTPWGYKFFVWGKEPLLPRPNCAQSLDMNFRLPQPCSKIQLL